jgi:alpha-glucosidase
MRNSAGIGVCIVISISYFASRGTQAFAQAAAASAQPLAVTSPAGNLAVSFSLKSLPPPYAAGLRPYYKVTFDNRDVFVDSPLGLQFDGTPALDRNLTVTASSTRSEDSSWEDAINDNRTVRDRYNELTVHLKEGPGTETAGRQLDIIFRAYDSGIAFRYVLPRQPGIQRFVLSDEDTGFYFARKSAAFALYLEGFTTPYEDEFRKIDLGEVDPGTIIGMPLLVHMEAGPWVAITEADLEDYAGMYITRAAKVPNGLATKLSPLPGRPGQAVVATAPKSTPWRLIMLSQRAGGLIEAHDLVLNLNPANALGDISWIEPGKTAWDWWSGDYATGADFKPGMNTATLEHYIQFAADHHLAYMLIDAGWARRSDAEHGWETADITHWNDNVDLPNVIAFARQRGVKVLLWMHWQSVKKQMAEAFPLFQKWGVSGIKIDFMNRDDQEMVNFYYQMAREAANHRLVVDFHGAFKPTGMRRTYPNQLTREGVLGMEYNKWSYRDTPYHHLILPFTRMLAGPLDYTPGCFNNAAEDQFEPRNVNPMCQATRAAQLAMYVVYFSPLQMLSDYPEDYDHSPGMDFLDQVPTVWDETRVLNGDPSEYVTIARRKGSTWYIGSMTDWTPRDLDLDLAFLGPGHFHWKTYADGPNARENAKDLTVSEGPLEATDDITIRLAPGGGWAAVVTPISAGP